MNPVNARVSPAHFHLRMPALLAAAAVVAIGAGGCSKPLLASSDERTPFDRYDAIRNQYARQYIENEFGAREPNLRGRLAPK